MDKDARQVIREAVRRMLREEDDASDDAPEEKAVLPKKMDDERDTSIDTQVDRLLSSYERDRSEEGDFDAEGFALDVFNLIEGHDDLIEFRNTVARRAAVQLKKSKGKDAAREFVKALESNHGVYTDKAKGEADDEIVPPVGQFGGPDVGGGIVGGAGGGAPAA